MKLQLDILFSVFSLSLASKRPKKVNVKDLVKEFFLDPRYVIVDRAELDLVKKKKKQKQADTDNDLKLIEPDYQEVDTTMNPTAVTFDDIDRDDVATQIATPNLSDIPSPYGNCDSMLASGRWQDPNLNFKTCDQNLLCKQSAWQPTSCHWHIYSHKDARWCLKHKNIKFFGDSKSRQLYVAFKSRLEKDINVFDDRSYRRFENGSVTPVDSWRFEDFMGNVKLNWEWAEKLTGEFEVERGLDRGDLPDVLIFNSLMLHGTKTSSLKLVGGAK